MQRGTLPLLSILNLYITIIKQYLVSLFSKKKETIIDIIDTIILDM